MTTRRSLAFLPWFSPSLSFSMAAVMQSLGHAVVFRRGEVVYESPERFFGKLMFVRRGIVVKALMDPSHDEPLLVTMSGPGGLCGSYENLYMHDRMPRRHWCMTTTEVLMVNSELLLRICDQNQAWQHELTNYSASSALSDRLGLIVNHSGTRDARVGTFLILCAMQYDAEFLKKLMSPGVEWVPLPVLPSRHVVRLVTNIGSEALGDVLQSWLKKGAFRYRSHKLLLRREVFEDYWNRLSPILRTS